MSWPNVTDFHAYDRRISVYRLEAGEKIPSHTHRWGHKIIVADGLVHFTKELHECDLEGPAMVSVEPAVAHEVVAISRSTVISIFGEEGSV